MARPIAKLGPVGSKVVHSIVAREFANRRGHGRTDFIVHRQMTRKQLTDLLVEAVNEFGVEIRRRARED